MAEYLPSLHDFPDTSKKQEVGITELRVQCRQEKTADLRSLVYFPLQQCQYTDKNTAVHFSGVCVVHSEPRGGSGDVVQRDTV